MPKPAPAISGGVPKAPPLPFQSMGSRSTPGGASAPSHASSSAAHATATPTGNSDDDICYHLRNVIERGAAKTSADVTTLQLSLTKPMMDALQQRHDSSLRQLIAKFPGRFHIDAAAMRVHLVGVPGTAPAAAAMSMHAPAAATTTTTTPGAAASAGAPTPKPQHPSEFRPSVAARQQQQQAQRDKEKQQQQQQQRQQQQVPSAPPPPTFAVPKLPNLPGAGAGGASSSSSSPAMAQHPTAQAMHMAFMSKSWKSPAEIVEELMAYVPTYWIPMRFVHNQLPFEVKELYQNKMRLNQFLKQFSYYFDSKITPKGAEIKVRDDCKHPKKGEADDRYGAHLRHMDVRAPSAADLGATAATTTTKRRAKPTRYVDVDPHSLAGQLKQLCSNTFQNIKDFQAALPAAITVHPEYDPGAGVLATFEKHPIIFQVADGSVRLRQSGVAPNALDSKGRGPADSPLPGVFAKVLQSLPDDCDTPIDVAVILAKLTSEERDAVRKQSRSLPRFLRVHGAAVEVSKDNTTVKRFEEPTGGGAGSGGGLTAEEEMLNNGADAEDDDPNEPSTISDGAQALPRPGKGVAEASPVQWALKELYSALPLSTCVPLDDAVSMLPSQMRDAAATCTDLVAEIEKYPDYFSVWQSPDDALVPQKKEKKKKTKASSSESENENEVSETKKTFIVQRTMIGQPNVDLEAVASSVASLVPQGGIDSEKLMRRLPPKIQRYLFRHGLKTTLKKMPDKFLVVGDKVLSIAVRD